MTRAYHRSDDLPDTLTVYTGGEERLFERAKTCPQPTEIVVTSVELHRRNLQRRLRERSLPKDAFEFSDPVGMSKQVLRNAAEPTKAIDRIDRLTLLHSILSDADSTEFELPTRIPQSISTDPQAVEQLRTEVESVTNFHSERTESWKQVADGLNAPIDQEATERLTVALDVERELKSRTQQGKAVSETELIRRATRTLTETDGSIWAETYESIDRITFLGLGSLSATHADLVHALIESTSVEVNIHFRQGTGEYLSKRLFSLIDINNPGQEVFA
ncbi:hypothetical protein [Natronoglomus mannanivorans]|uniref:Uncharacterized protein n=1 Tax=Natronoglomus mannanivorans TaxID=2979990 RepID=A0AAP2Z435_9EURY|nr:hypothetical protein [Halobacteria archaeon AArc-xg1-1]